MFIADTIQSVKAALDLGKTLEAITRIRGEVEEIQTRLEELKSAAETQTAELREQAELLATGLKENAAQKLAEFQEDINQRLEDDFPELNARLHALLEYRHSLSEKLGTYRAGLIRRNPTASSARFNEALKELKEYLEELKDSRKQE